MKFYEPFLILSLIIFTITSFQEALSATFQKARISEHPVIVVLSYDGFRHDYMSKTQTPNLDRLKSEGVSVPYLKNQFPTKTIPNHFSIPTGLHTESHGVTDNEVYDRKLGRNLTVQDEEMFHYNSDVIPIWTLNELAGNGRVSGANMWAGSNFPFGGQRTLPTHLMKFSPGYNALSAMDNVFNWITNETHPANLVFAYFEEPDKAGHGFGPDSAQVEAAIRTMDGVTGYLVNKLESAGIYEDVNLILLSDHGMAAVQTGNIINLKGVVDTSLYRRYGRSPVINILPNEVILCRPTGYHLPSILRSLQNPKFQCIPKGIDQYFETDWFYQTNDQRIMPIVLVADTGFAFDDIVLLSDYNTDETKTKMIGLHGFDNGDRSMSPYFIARGPLFRNGGVSVAPFSNIDLFPLLCYLLGIPTPPNNGSLTNSQVILNNRAKDYQNILSDADLLIN